MQNCTDCAEMKLELASLKQTIMEYFQQSLPNIALVAQQSEKLHQRLDVLTQVLVSGGATTDKPASTDSGHTSTSSNGESFVRDNSSSDGDGSPSAVNPMEESNSKMETVVVDNHRQEDRDSSENSASNANSSGNERNDEKALDLVVSKKQRTADHVHMQQPLSAWYPPPPHQQTIWPTVTASWLIGQAKQAGEHHYPHHHRVPRPQLAAQPVTEFRQPHTSNISDIKDFRHLCVINRLSGRFVCCLCESSFTQFSNLRRHIRVIHQGESKHACRYCDKVFVWKGAWRRHEQVVHEAKRKHGPSHSEQNGTFSEL